MSYDELVTRIAANSGLTHERIKAVLEHLPEALMFLRRGEKVRTPLGIFEMVVTQQREVMLPDGQRTAQAQSKLGVKLRPGQRLRRVF